jgi:hypothetical protein
VLRYLSFFGALPNAKAKKKTKEDTSDESSKETEDGENKKKQMTQLQSRILLVNSIAGQLQEPHNFGSNQSFSRLVTGRISRSKPDKVFGEGDSLYNLA